MMKESHPAPASHPPPKARALVAGLVILLIAIYRMAPHPWNVTPAGALFLLSGLFLGRSWRGWAVPFGAMILSDALLYWRLDSSLWRWERLIDYLAFALVGLLGRAAAGRSAAARVGAVLAAPFVFYLVSNFGVWLAGGLYARTAQGLVDCYVAAVPFLRGSVLGDWLFASAGIMAIEGLPRVRLRTSPARTASAAVVISD